MKLSSVLVSAPLAALIVTLFGAPALPAFAFAATAFLLALAGEDYAPRRPVYPAATSPWQPAAATFGRRRARWPLAA